ncbi:MAG: hypothetical protein ACE5FB_00755 [Candidatus Binatia bacterium]
MSLLRRKRFFIAWLILLLAVQSAQAQKIRYFYDDLGRLIGVVDQEGNAARYVYDEVGNLLEIRRTNVADFTGPVAITFFDPDQGQVGTQVTIFGAVFSDTPGENTISFNGVSAPVLAASTNSLTTRVADGATTGPISVTTPLGSATSLELFTVVGTVTVSPAEATLVVRGRSQFTATVTVLNDKRVTWSVNGIEGGNETVGVITAEGVYTAPSTVPTSPEVTIRADSVPFPNIFGEATVMLVQDPTDFAQAAVSVRFGPVPPGTIAASPVSVSFGPPPPGTIGSAPLSVAFGPPPLGTIGSSSLSVAFGTPPAVVGEARAVSVANAPVITSVVPDTAPRGTTFTLALTGANFTGAISLVFSFEGRRDSGINVTNAAVSPGGDLVTADITISATATAGPRIVIVQTGTGSSTGADTGNNVLTITAS